MKTYITGIGAVLLAVGICIWSTQALAQTTTTVTTTKGAFTEYVPGSETMVVRSDAGPAPLRYTVTKQTTIVDESGAPLAIERIPRGSQLSVQYSGSGDHLTASRVIVQRQSATTVPVTSAPVVEQRTSAPVVEQRTSAPVVEERRSAPVTEQQTTTTTSTTHPMTHEEKHALKEEKEHRKKAAKEEIERQKDALDKAKDKLDDDHSD
jgi:hypothetical protein